MPISEQDPAGAEQGVTAAVREEAGYWEQEGSQLYYVLHYPRGVCRAGAVLAGPFGSRRNEIYISWVRWARYLAQQGFMVLRFDYRGTGESGGDFETMCISGWFDDLRLCTQRLKSRIGDRPLLVHGLGLGGLLASKAFGEGMGDALLMWSPPASGREMLLEELRQKVFGEYTRQTASQRKTREDYVKELEAGGCVDVEGYVWSPLLWEDAAKFTLEFRDEDGSGATIPGCCQRARMVRVDSILKGRVLNRGGRNPNAIFKGQPLNPNLEPFFKDEAAWIGRAFEGK